jgi:hypothetical protein
VPLNTAGGTVVIHGTGFGPVGTAVTASLTSASVGLTIAASCTIAVPHTSISCTTSPGYGRGYSWVVTVGGQASVTSTFTTAFAVPVLSSLVSPVPLATAGGTSVTINGGNFGNGNAVVTGTYSSTSTGLTLTAACTVTVAHTQVRCTSSEGYGAGYVWVIAVAGLSSSASSFQTTYAAPVLASQRSVQHLAAPVVSMLMHTQPSGWSPLCTSSPTVTLATAGGTQLTLVGDNLGTSNAPLSVTYSSAATSLTLTAACRVSSAHTAISCVAAPGFGSGWVAARRRSSAGRSPASLGSGANLQAGHFICYAPYPFLLIHTGTPGR